MTEGQRKALAAVLREHMTQKAELRAMRTILAEAAQSGRAPKNWKRHLEQLRKSLEYRDLAEQFEAQIAQIERGNAESELMESLRKMFEGKLPN